VLDTEADLKDGTRSFPAEGARGDIAWRHVSFRYRPETPVLNGVELRVPAGAKIAVIGPTGAGKSTLLGLKSSIARSLSLKDGESLPF